MKRLSNRPNRILMSESSIRSLITKLLLEADGDVVPEDVAKKDLIGLLTYILETKEKTFDKDGNDVVSTTSIKNILGYTSDDGRGLYAFPLELGDNKFNSIDQLANHIVSLKRKDGTPMTPRNMAAYIINAYEPELKRIYPNGVSVLVYGEDGKPTGDKIQVGPMTFLVMCAFDNKSSASTLEEAQSSMTSRDFGKYTRLLTLGESKTNMSSRFMNAIKKVATSTGLSSSVSSLNSVVNVETEGGATANVSAIIDEVNNTARAIVPVNYDAGRTVAASAVLSGDLGSKILDAISGGSFGGIAQIPDPFQTLNDLDELSNALKTAYDTGLLVLTSEATIIPGATEIDELRFQNDQMSGLSTAVYTAAALNLNRSQGDDIIVIGASLVSGASALAALGSYLGATKAGAQAGLAAGSPWYKFLGSVGRMFKLKTAARLNKRIKELAELKTTVGPESPAGQALDALITKEIEKITASGPAAMTWNDLRTIAMLGRQRLRDANSAKIAADVEKIVADPIFQVESGFSQLIQDAVGDLLTKMDDLNDLKVAVDAARDAGDPDALVAAQAAYDAALGDFERSRLAAVGTVETALDGLETRTGTKVPLAIRDKLTGLLSQNVIEAISGTGGGGLPNLGAATTLSEAMSIMSQTVSREGKAALSIDPEFIEFGKTIMWQDIKSVPIAALMGLFGSWVFARAYQKSASAGPAGEVSGQLVGRLNTTDESGSLIAKDAATRKTQLSNNGVLDESARDLVNDITFRTAIIRNPGQRAQIEELVAACKAVMSAAVDVQSSDAATAIARLKTAREGVNFK